jgi:uncharacterized membrane protein required for colicin V production
LRPPKGRCYPSPGVPADRGAAPLDKDGLVNVSEFLASLDLNDVFIVLFLFGCFVLGFVQGTIRRLVGILSMVFSFFLAAVLSVPVGDFLAQHWEQFPAEYAVMLGFLILFVAAVIAFSVVIQGTYKKAPLFANYTIVDEVLGGILGVIEGILLLTFLLIILDQFFLLTNFPTDDDELPLLRGFWNALSGSGFGGLLHTYLVPAVVAIGSFLLPDSIEQMYGSA